MRTRRAMVGLAVLAAIGAIVLIRIGAWRVEATHGDLAERHWTAAHGRVGRYRVVEVNEQRPDGSALSVWARVPGHGDAFVDLEGSAEKVDHVGQTLGAVVDSRADPSPGVGYAPDNVRRSTLLAYAASGWPLGLGLLLVGLAVLCARSRREPATASIPG